MKYEGLKFTTVQCPQYHPGDYVCPNKLIPELGYTDGSGTILADEVAKRWNDNHLLYEGRELAMNVMRSWEGGDLANAVNELQAWAQELIDGGYEA